MPWIDKEFFLDITVFTGAQSNIGQTNWFWENGAILVNDSRYLPSNKSVCQQMFLTLAYNDGINLLPKRCDQDEAYFACDIQCMLTSIDKNVTCEYIC